MQIYNTLSGKKEAFSPQEKKKINMYVCGITPYDKSHLGHARTLTSFDIIRRYFSFRGFAVTYVQNVTDIDDKIIKRAHERKMKPLELSKKYTHESDKEFELLGIEKPTAAPKVSENIPEIIGLIGKIVKNGYAYATDSGVYFDVEKFGSYGALSHQTIDTVKAGARIEVDEKKKHPADFALWKLGEEEGVTFDSPWGRGRPGWHIECSAMSTTLLGDTLDIHGGARDLIFPHHENEIAQSEAATGKEFVKLWMHTGFLTVNGEKMAKSLGNFITIEDALQKYKYTPQQIRMFFAATHYRSPIDFSESAIEAAGKSLSTLHSAIHAAKSYPLPASGNAKLSEAAHEAEKKFDDAMDDDFDAPSAFAALFALARKISGACSEGSAGKNDALVAAATLEKLLGVFGLEPHGEKKQEKGGMSDSEIDALVKKRDEARKAKDYAASDKIRKELDGAGIMLEDRKDSTTAWRRK
ncbi:MAG: cysteine--tRNA ligase [Candidatus Micrarchaeota archaeon]|nr:cysteine--tRNA ligase [Candidatus Micrarchaeota archaeon]